MKVAPHEPRWLLQRSAVHAQLKHAEQARNDWEMAKKLDPSLKSEDRPVIPPPPKPAERKKLTPEEAAALGTAMTAFEQAWARGDMAACQKEAENAYRLDPTSAQAHSFRARVLVQTGRNQESIDEATEAIRIDPADVWAYASRGLARNRLKDHAGAIADYTIALRLDSKNYQVWNNRGYAYHLRGQYHQELADFNESLRLNPGYSGAFQNRAACYLHFGEYDKALADFLKVADAQPTNPQPRRYCAAIFAKLGNLEEARKQRDLAIKIDARLKDAPDITLPVPLPPVKQDPELDAR